jgi:hypothetical protein
VASNGQTIDELIDGAAFPSWDAKLSFSLEREFRIDRDIARELRIDSKGSCCELVVSAATGGGLTREVLFRKAIAGSDRSEIHVTVSPSSQRLARELVLTTGIYLSNHMRSKDPLAPAIAGSRLWEMTERIRLEGGAARLPIYEVPFSRVFAGDRIEHAEFHVEVAEDPDLDVESALTVYLNSERPAFVTEVGVQGSPAERRLWRGILRRVLTSAILSSDLMSSPPGESSSLAATVQRWGRMIWPSIPVDSLRSLPAAGYSKFEGQIESWLNALESAKTGDASP